MVFSSLTFLFAFLVPVMAVYWIVPRQARNGVLLCASLVFYAWGGPAYLVLLVGETLVSWLCALGIERAGDGPTRRLPVVVECLVLLGLLGYFKYTGLILGTSHALLGIPEVVPEVVLPIGISFYTFQLISYVVDVYRRSVPAQHTFWKLLLYSSLFHQCIAGPIVRYATVADEIEGRRATPDDVYEGVRRFSVGLAKKAVLANACATVADELLPVGMGAAATQAASGAWLGMVFYTLQIYLDFSAYSDMAIGLGRMVGFHYLENFNHPYQSVSVQDFWRRWHISLGTFFRDYVYIPLGGNRVPTMLYVRNMAVVWLLTGLWHGASWNYLLWGAYYLVFLLLERFIVRGRIPSVLSHPITMVVVVVGWVLFRFEDFGEMAGVLVAMTGLGPGGLTGLAVHTALLQNVFLLVAGCVACTSLGTHLRGWARRNAEDGGVGAMVYAWGERLVPPLMLLVSVCALAGASYNPFIYFQF